MSTKQTSLAARMARRPLHVRRFLALSLAAVMVPTIGGCSDIGRGQKLVTPELAELANEDIDLARAAAENTNRLIDPAFVGKTTVVQDPWGFESTRLFFKRSHTLFVAENSDAAKLRAASIAVSQRAPMVVYDDSVRNDIYRLAEDVGANLIVTVGKVPFADAFYPGEERQHQVVRDPGNTKALGEYTAFGFTSKVVIDPNRMVEEVAALDSNEKIELKAAWEPLPQQISHKKMPAIPGSARRDGQMSPNIVATSQSPIANVVNANAYGGTVLIMPDPDPSATKVGAAMVAGLEEGPVVALGPEFGSAKEFSAKISRGWTE
ncbi:hypothetical protein I6I73_02035 [Corynebacterium striatum]|nr:hypothetical protein I6I73_02035 [Corynebacterium striatum]